jgi:hypothetical protein
MNRELEKEIERIRTFYTKKIEDVQRKADAQIRALKRNGPSALSGSNIPEERMECVKEDNLNAEDKNADGYSSSKGI